MTYQILKGNSLDLLPTLADNSIDAIVTDPPYGLGNPDPDYIIKAIQLWASGDRAHIPEGKGFMGKSWDSFVPPPAIWDECLRVLKPGGHLLAFAGTRTYDLMGISIRMAGFEIRDSIGWVYGSGFPKSLDVSKAIDKAAGAERDVIGLKPDWVKFRLPEIERVKNGEPSTMNQRNQNLAPEFYKTQASAGYNNPEQGAQITAPSTPEAKQWQGWGTALKPALEPIVVARKPLMGTVAENVLTHGTGGLNIDASRIGYASEYDKKHQEDIRKGSGTFFGGNGESKSEQTSMQGRWPANLILSHAESCQPTGKTIKSKTGAGKRTATFGTQDTQSGGDGSGGWSGYEYETEVYECVEGCPVKTLDEQSGTSKSGKPGVIRNTNTHNVNAYGDGIGARAGESRGEFGDSGGASRFFYVAKASKRDRNEGLEDLEETTAADMVDREADSAGMNSPRAGAGRTSGAKNFHPTVKPTELMRYLVKLITPPGGTVLDPFTGSGSTGKAAILEGFDFIGIELTEDYWPIIEGRLKHAEAKVAERIKETSDQEQEKLF
jgi:site-specific DNA-methyltransferase (adenine-specific)